MWTDTQVQSRLVEATDTLRRLPDHNPLYSSRTFWPDIRKQPQSDWPTPTKAKTGPPTNIHIDRYLETLDWLQFIKTKGRERDIVFWTCYGQMGTPRKRVTYWDAVRKHTGSGMNDEFMLRAYQTGLSIIAGRLTAREYEKGLDFSVLIADYI